MSKSQSQNKKQVFVQEIMKTSLVEAEEGGSNESSSGQDLPPPTSKNMWTRVICVSQTTDEDLKIWNIEKDQQNRILDIPKIRAKPGRSWAPVFFVNDFLADDPVLELEHFALKERKLRMLGERVTKLREHILAVAKD